MNIVVSEPGTKLKMRQNRLLLSLDDEVIRSYPINHIETIICGTGVYVTEPVMSYITSHYGSILFVKKTGKLKYIIHPLNSILSVKARMKQYTLNDEIKIRLALSKQIVYCKVQNGQRFLTEKFTHNAVDNLTKLRQLRDRSLKAISLDELRGVEGAASKEYFRLFRYLLPSTMSFKARVKRVSRDQINASFDFIYSLLYHTSFTAIMAVGLDPYLGFYHSHAYGHAALSSDIMEPFRAQIADRVVLNAMKDSAFHVKDDNKTSNYRLTKKRIQVLMTHYTKRIQAVQKVNGGGLTNFDLIIRDARNLRNYCLDPSQGYRPWVRA